MEGEPKKLTSGLGFAAVDQSPQMPLRSIKLTWTKPDGDNVVSESASCFHCTAEP